ncbi:hypothetical protein [Bifidobacterium sp. ESL0790]|uniref:hypothetical protein n=1 Tax=Bifidobacterium sp. ESL0790 TaxID=2983233 RepID=UPI0023F71BAB|nr:hypothetical protein [Bifidobacterium sp. ESL0790]WEV73081.1 hypothetical protein OZY47_03815 [Bifidobacterium sp. ESL0790]
MFVGSPQANTQEQMNSDYQVEINNCLTSTNARGTGGWAGYVFGGIFVGFFFVYLSLAYSTVSTVLIVAILVQYVLSLALMLLNGSFAVKRSQYLTRCAEFFALLLITLYTDGQIEASRIAGSFSKLLQGTGGQWHRKFIDDFIIIWNNRQQCVFADWLDIIQLTAGAILCVCLLVYMLLDSVGMFVICGNYVPKSSHGFVARKTKTFNEITIRGDVWLFVCLFVALILSSRSVVALCMGIFGGIKNFIDNSYTH